MANDKIWQMGIIFIDPRGWEIYNKNRIWPKVGEKGGNMSVKLKRFTTAFLTLCMLLSMLSLMPVKARAETTIEKVLTTLSYEPVALMEVGFITAATSTEGCYVSSIAWYNSNYVQETNYFNTGTYHLEIRLNANEGYVFSQSLVAYLDNSEISVTWEEPGSSVVLKRDYEPMLWQPTIIKHPGAETVTEGGWASFVSTATYANEYKWSLMDPSGRSIACSEVNTKFPNVSVNGDGTGKIIIYNIPLEMDGWKAVCQFTGPGGSVRSNGALITVNADPTKPSPSPSPSPSPEATEEPDEHEHDFSVDWSSDEESHWHQCDCGELADKAGHSFEWTVSRAATQQQPGEERGICRVCKYESTREVSYQEEEPGDNAVSSVDFTTFKLVLYAVLGLIILGLVLLIVSSIRDSKGRKHRRRRK